MINLNKKNNTESGFVILFSILVSTIILMMAGGIFRIAQKETILSSYSREAQVAFYAADAALECALFWDISLYIPDSTSRFQTSQTNGTSTPSFNCGTDTSGDSQSIQGDKYNVNAQVYDHVFGFRYANEEFQAGCAFVFVEKNNPTVSSGPEPVFSPTETRLTAIGYNVCDGDTPDLDDPRLLERRLSVLYSGL